MTRTRTEAAPDRTEQTLVRLSPAEVVTSRTPEYKAWIAMRQRCANPRASGYRHYGGRGIRVCDEWEHSFAAFLECVGPRPSPEHSIDRIDVDGHYEPGNVRWATINEQASNRRPRPGSGRVAVIPIRFSADGAAAVETAAAAAGMDRSAWMRAILLATSRGTTLEGQLHEMRRAQRRMERDEALDRRSRCDERARIEVYPDGCDHTNGDQVCHECVDRVRTRSRAMWAAEYPGAEYPED